MNNWDDWNAKDDCMTTTTRTTGKTMMNRMTWTVITGVTGMIVMKTKSRITGVARMNGMMR